MSEKIKFRLLESEMEPYKAALGKAADTILEQDVSEYPIFVVHQQQMDIGIPLFEKEEVKGNWSIHASTLEEFVTKQVILPEKVDDFKAVFKNPALYLCLFVLSELGATFIFLPRYDEDEHP